MTTGRRHLPLASRDADLPSSTDRREWLKQIAAGVTLATLGGCTRFRGEHILPYPRPPRHATPGIPRTYATSLSLDGFATGVLVESYDGRPTKIEGNPDHPASLGATSAFDQAAVFDLYDPSRARALRAPGHAAATWEIFRERFAAGRADGGAGLRFLLGPTGSPLAGDLIDRIRARFPAARFTFCSSCDGASVDAGARIAFGAPAQPVHDFSHADVILSIGHDFLGCGPFSLRYARQWSARRRPASPGADMSRLYVIETMPTPTGTVADHRLRRKPGAIAVTTAHVAAEIAAGPHGKRLPAPLAAALARLRGDADPMLHTLAVDLTRAAGKSVITVGPEQPAVVHALGHVLNQMLSGPEATWTIAPTRVDAGDAQQDLAALAQEMDRGAVDTLVVLEQNAVYSAPADLDLARRLAQVRDVVYLGQHEDETAEHAGWFVPAAHALESWGDATAYDGTVSLVQPLIDPLYDGRTATEVLALFAGDPAPDARHLLRARWTGQNPGFEGEKRWDEALRRGIVAGTAAPRRPPQTLAVGSLVAALERVTAPAAGLELAFALDPSVHDGRFANNAWLLELPQPVTHLTWDNAAHVSPQTARQLGLESEDVVELVASGRSVRAPVFVVVGHADDAVTVHLGWGRGDVGFDAGALRTTRTPSFAPGLSIRKIPGAHYPLARTQRHHRTEDRPIALANTLAAYREDPEFTAAQRGDLPTVLAPVDMSGEQWAMTIDLSICTGCSACVVACQAENNILVVGKDQVMNARVMHWIRIDTYFRGADEDPRFVHEPMLCQHCEKAPCEYVCPVNATVHSPDGLNEMVYNRCVGTRFCSNNCPYKVRRFNWFDWNVEEPHNAGSVMLQRNPEVTVRQRGVMEKCSYCVQRIRGAEIHARVEGREIRAGEVVTACQEACPTQAIQFGSLRHHETEVVRWRDEPRLFEELHELGTRPRTQYLARIDNPNPEIA